MEFLKAVLSDPRPARFVSCAGTVARKRIGCKPVVSLLTNNCPELASLRVEFGNYYAFDFVSSMLEHPSNKLKVLEMPKYRGDSTRFFATLGQSQVSALTLSYSPKFAQGLFEYLARDLLVRLKVTTYFERVPPGMMMSLADCTRLAELEILGCEFSQPTAFTHVPKSESTRERLGYPLEGKGAGRVAFVYCDFVNETLAVGGVELGRIKRLDIDSPLNDASVEQIAFALKSPNSEMKELSLWHDDMASSTTHLVPALKHPNCNLAKLSFRAFGSEHEEAAERMEDMFYNRLALFVLLQGRQVRRQYCPLSRLPVEMFRLVGEVLI
ncbi:hypothetical protein BASA81_007873 [Batrachochytrium salamandrivorans]|nr:hypothetical protein BASA81_007873 [Batrachochytrium salamandrivorans]